MSLIIHTHTVSHFEQNARIIHDPETNEAIIIDPGAEETLLFEATKNYSVTTIFITHCHIDHAGATTKLLNCFKNNNKPLPNVIYHSNEIIVGEHIEIIANQYGLPQGIYENPPKPGQLADSLNSISVGSHELKLLFTPGHAPGHIALYYPNDTFSLQGSYSEKLDCKHLLIAGDTLFAGSIGRTDLPLANHDQLISSIQSQLLSLPENTLVCPGHGPNTTIKNEKEANPFLN